MRVAVNELQKLSRELDIDHTTRTYFEVILSAELAFDFVAHRADGFRHLGLIVRGTVDRLLGDSCHLRAQGRVARDRTQLHERLMLPEPRFLLVVATKRRER